MEQHLNHQAHLVAPRVSMDARLQASSLPRQSGIGALPAPSSTTPLTSTDDRGIDDGSVSRADDHPAFLGATPSGNVGGRTSARARYEHSPIPLSDHDLQRLMARQASQARGLTDEDLLSEMLASYDQPQGLSFYPSNAAGDAAAFPSRPSEAPYSAQAAILAASKAGLDEDALKTATDYMQNNTHTKLDILMIHILSLEQNIQKLEQDFDASKDYTTKTYNLVKASFTMRPEQKAALRKLLRHMLAQPLVLGYNKKNIVENCMEYITQKRSKFGFEKFATDETIKGATEAYLNEWASTDKSEFRKYFFRLCDMKLDLDELVTTLMKEVHLTPRPAAYDKKVYAFIALYRHTAATVIASMQPGQRDTGFWRDLNAAVADLAYIKDSWIDEIIAKDRQAYDIGSLATTAEEEDEIVEDEVDEEPECPGVMAS
ncbi:hypothetical protein EV715DRAFT_208438 [Schizophyllum commune]